MLSSRGLVLKVADHVYSDEPMNVVVRQTPTSGQLMKVSQQAHVVLSLGQRQLEVPLLEGSSLRVSRIELLRAGLQVGEVSNVTMPDAPVDQVVEQTPRPGAGAATPRVDVLVSGSPPGATQGAVTQTLLQDVEVLSAGQNFQKDAEGKPASVAVVNLLVTPQQAEMLSLAGNQTTIQLVLRNPLDHDITKTSGSAVVQLFHPGGPPLREPRPRSMGQTSAAPVRSMPAPPVAQAPVPRVVEVISGVKRTETQFEPRAEVRP